MTPRPPPPLLHKDVLRSSLNSNQKQAGCPEKTTNDQTKEPIHSKSAEKLIRKEMINSRSGKKPEESRKRCTWRLRSSGIRVIWIFFRPIVADSLYRRFQKNCRPKLLTVETYGLADSALIGFSLMFSLKKMKMFCIQYRNGERKAMHTQTGYQRCLEKVKRHHPRP